MGSGAGQEPVWGTKVKNAFLDMLTIRCFVAMLHGQKLYDRKTDIDSPRQTPGKEVET